MNKIAIAFLAAFARFVWLQEEGRRRGDGRHEKYKTDLCACKTTTSSAARRLGRVHEVESENAGKATDMSAKPDPDMEKLQTEIADCTKRVMTPTPARPVAPRAALPGRARLRRRLGHCGPAGGAPPAA